MALDLALGSRPSDNDLSPSGTYMEVILALGKALKCLKVVYRHRQCPKSASNG
jgi:hypothetical protein